MRILHRVDGLNVVSVAVVVALVIVSFFMVIPPIIPDDIGLIFYVG
jgi:hypothetical protein